MTTLFSDFSATYRDFRKEFTGHPVEEEIRTGLGRRRFPTDEWLRKRTRKMKRMMFQTPLDLSRRDS